MCFLFAFLLYCNKMIISPSKKEEDIKSIYVPKCFQRQLCKKQKLGNAAESKFNEMTHFLLLLAVLILEKSIHTTSKNEVNHRVCLLNCLTGNPKPQVDSWLEFSSDIRKFRSRSYAYNFLKNIFNFATKKMVVFFKCCEMIPSKMSG